MKKVIYILTFLVLTSCGQSNTEQKTMTVSTDMTSTGNNINVLNNSKEDEQSEEDYRKQSLDGFEKATFYKLTDTITADFNGDGILDKAFYKKENEMSGVIIKHGHTNEEVRIGFGQSFAHLTDFDWVDYWGLVEDKETSETTFTEDGDVSDSQVVKLQNPSIVLGADEEGGGLITYKNGKYVWIHQTC
jgi:hypothetical protein